MSELKIKHLTGLWESNFLFASDLESLCYECPKRKGGLKDICDCWTKHGDECPVREPIKKLQEAHEQAMALVKKIEAEIKELKDDEPLTADDYADMWADSLVKAQYENPSLFEYEMSHYYF